MTQDEFEALLKGKESSSEFADPYAAAERFGIPFDEYHEHMVAHNERVFDKWLVDYAGRLNRPVDEVRDEVLEQQRLIRGHCNEVYRHEMGLR